MVLLQLLSIHDGAVGVTNLGVMLLWSGLLPLNFLIVIYALKPMKTPRIGVICQCNCAHGKYIFLLEKFISLIILTWFQMYRWKFTLHSGRFSHCYC